MTEQEFGHIARDCSGRLKALARRFCRAADLAIDEEDLVQEALLAFWNLSEKGYPVRNAKALLVKITKTSASRTIADGTLRRSPLPEMSSLAVCLQRKVLMFRMLLCFRKKCTRV